MVKHGRHSRAGTEPPPALAGRWLGGPAIVAHIAAVKLALHLGHG